MLEKIESVMQRTQYENTEEKNKGGKKRKR